MDSRSQTSSYRMLQKPEMKKKRKNQSGDPDGLERADIGIVTRIPEMKGFEDEMVGAIGFELEALTRPFDKLRSAQLLRAG